MSLKLVKCEYGKLEGDNPDMCCLVSGETENTYRHCDVYDLQECPFKKRVKGCGTCAFAVDATLDADGSRMIDCEGNELQMYAPYATECKHWIRMAD